MSPTQDIEVEGTTQFEWPTKKTYRYVIQLKNDKLSIWMEDRASKKQWYGNLVKWPSKALTSFYGRYKGGMDKTTYLTSANAIPDATAVDYVQCFQDAIDCDPDDCSVAQRKLTPTTDGSLRLELIVTIRLFRSTWQPKYVFDLEPVSVERIDILESKLRDQQEQLDDIMENLRALQSKDEEELPLIRLEATAKASTNVCWNKTNSECFVVAGGDGVIQIRGGGIYNVSGVVTCVPSGHNQSSQLMVNGVSCQTTYASYTQGHYSSIPLTLVAHFEEDDKLTVTVSCNLTGTSFLSVVRLSS